MNHHGVRMQNVLAPKAKVLVHREANDRQVLLKAIENLEHQTILVYDNVRPLILPIEFRYGIRRRFGEL